MFDFNGFLKSPWSFLCATVTKLCFSAHIFYLQHYFSKWKLNSKPVLHPPMHNTIIKYFQTFSASLHSSVMWRWKQLLLAVESVVIHYRQQCLQHHVPLKCLVVRLELSSPLSSYLTVINRHYLRCVVQLYPVGLVTGTLFTLNKQVYSKAVMADLIIFLPVKLVLFSVNRIRCLMMWNVGMSNL